MNSVEKQLGEDLLDEVRAILICEPPYKISKFSVETDEWPSPRSTKMITLDFDGGYLLVSLCRKQKPTKPPADSL
jgi:hypothetical protein